jgi:tetratricopeptide (TPR) repeat protein
MRAMALARIGDFDGADEMIRQALEAAPHAGSPVKEADAHIAVSFAYYDMGEPQKGIEHARIGADLAFNSGGIECACAGYFSVGLGQLQRARVQEALGEFGRSLQLADFSGWEGFVNMIHGGIANAEYLQGSAEALAALEAVREKARSYQDDFTAMSAALQLADAYLQFNRVDDAIPLVEEAIKHYRGLGMRPYLARSLALMAAIQSKLGDPQAAKQAADEAATLRSTFRRSPTSTAQQPEPTATHLPAPD